MQKVKIPFNRNLFYEAMVSVLKRAPDYAQERPTEGFYEYRYEPHNRKELKFLLGHFNIIQAMLSFIRQDFSKSKCCFTESLAGDKSKECLLIKIQLPAEDIKKAD